MSVFVLLNEVRIRNNYNKKGENKEIKLCHLNKIQITIKLLKNVLLILKREKNRSKEVDMKKEEKRGKRKLKMKRLRRRKLICE